MTGKRDSKRFRKRIKVKFGIDNPSRLAFTEDISPRGIFIKTANISRLGTRMIIEVTFPDNSLARFLGSIRWSKRAPQNLLHLVKKCGLGIKIISFISGEENYKKFIEEITNER